MNAPGRKRAPRSAPARVVVIGATAGGVHALRALAASLPADLAAAVPLVRHVGSHPSICRSG